MYDGTKVELKAFNSSSNSKPTLVDLPTGYSMKVTVKTDNNSIYCKFTRSVDVPSGSDDLMYDLSQSLYLLHAFGNVQNGDIVAHFEAGGVNNAEISASPTIIAPEPGKPVRISFFTP